MKKFLVFLSLLSLLLTSISVGFGQGRPRRVTLDTNTQQTQIPSPPAKAPVLGGATIRITANQNSNRNNSRPGLKKSMRATSFA